MFAWILNTKPLSVAADEAKLSGFVFRVHVRLDLEHKAAQFGFVGRHTAANSFTRARGWCMGDKRFE